ncbi:MAG: hypothetical protein US33_C0006G0006 [Parcubacteria group bacterium GW2011_GWC1_36_9]|nr:MAG: hypothetical protein US33_C0006G0006 [Parcubacteria group bacterium GW2011_GWC1_36_9]
MKDKRIKFVFSTEFKKILEKMAKKDKLGLSKIEDRVYKIISNPIVRDARGARR